MLLLPTVVLFDEVAMGEVWVPAPQQTTITHFLKSTTLPISTMLAPRIILPIPTSTAAIETMGVALVGVVINLPV